MARYKFTREDCSKGGKVAASLPGFPEIQAKGTQATYDRHGRLALRHICRKAAGQRKRA